MKKKMKKKTQLNEVRQLQKIAGILKEYFETDPESVQEAFQKAGIDMNTPVVVVEASGHYADEPRRANPTELVNKLQKIKDTQQEEGVHFDYEAAVAYPAQEYGLEGMEAKLSVGVSDAYEFVIFQ